MHKSVGVIIKRIKDDAEEILLIERATKPFGWACPSGHIDERETPEKAAIREFKEEVNLDIKNPKLLIHEFLDWNECSKGVKGHDWYIFESTKWEGETNKSDREVKNISWVKKEDLQKMNLEPVWEYWFKKLNILKK